MDALIRLYTGIEPAELDDEQWSIVWNDLKFALEFESERNQLRI